MSTPAEDEIRERADRLGTVGEDGTRSGSGVRKYRKKPVVVEAYCMTRAGEAADWPAWLKAAYDLPRGTEGSMFKDETNLFQVVTLESHAAPLTVSWGDYIIRGVQGEIYPCRPDIFAATYEAYE